MTGSHSNAGSGRHRPQRGVALPLALALILFSTLLGMSALQIGTDDMRSIGGDEMGRRAFHVAEAAANDTFRTLSPGTLSRTAETTLDSSSIDAQVPVVVRVRHEGLVPVQNSSLRLLARSAYAIQSTASSMDGGISRTVVLGAAQLVPMNR